MYQQNSPSRMLINCDYFVPICAPPTILTTTYNNIKLFQNLEIDFCVLELY